MSATWISIIGVVISGAVAVWVATINRRPAERATEAAAETDRRQADVDSWKELTKGLQTEVNELRDEVRQQRLEIDDLRRHVADLERDRDHITRLLARALAYIRDLRAQVRAAGRTPSAAPAGLDVTD